MDSYQPIETQEQRYTNIQSLVIMTNEEHLSEANIILTNSRVNLTISRNMTTECKKHNNRNPLLNFISMQTWRMFAIDIHKTLSTSRHDKFSISSFLDKTKSGIYQFKKPTNDFIMKWDSRIINYEHLIRKIRVFRNKYYAHTDDSYYESLDMNYKEAEKLVSIVQEFLVDAYMLRDTHLVEAEDLIDHIARQQDINKMAKYVS